MTFEGRMQEPADPQASAPIDDVRRTLQVGRRKGRKVVRWIVMALALVAIVLGTWTAMRRRENHNAPRWVTEQHADPTYG